MASNTQITTRAVPLPDITQHAIIRAGEEHQDPERPSRPAMYARDTQIASYSLLLTLSYRGDHHCLLLAAGSCRCPHRFDTE